MAKTLILPPERACSTCDYAGSNPNNDALRICRRRSPAIVRVNLAIWPTVALTDWCGEYRQVTE